MTNNLNAANEQRGTVRRNPLEEKGNSRAFIRQETLRDAIIYEIIDLEWNMMIIWKQQEGSPLTEEGFENFYRVRYSQHNALNSDTLALYKSDLNLANQTGRNLMAEKYAFIRSRTAGGAMAGDDMAGGAVSVPTLDPAVEKLVAEILPEMKASHHRFAQKYPSLASAGQAFDADGTAASPEVYMESELRIMEEATLQLLLRDVRLEPDFVQGIYETLVGFFGQDSLEKAEVLTKAHTMQSCCGKTIYE